MHPVIAYSVLHSFAQENQKRRRYVEWTLQQTGKTGLVSNRILARLTKLLRNR
jgi:hypothetical protein